jgi:rubrerythrin
LYNCKKSYDKIKDSGEVFERIYLSSNLTETLEEMKKIEYEVADSLAETAEKATNPFVKTLITSLVNDSRKHAQILQTLLDFKTGKVEKSFVDVGMGPRVKLSQALLQHQTTEAELAEKYTNFAREVDDPLVSRFIESIAEDEKRHHAAVSAMIDILGSQESTVSEIWDGVARSMYMLVQDVSTEKA